MKPTARRLSPAAMPFFAPSRRLVLHLGAALLAAAAVLTAHNAHAAADATVVEAVQLPAHIERSGQRRAAEPGAASARLTT